MVTIRGSWLWMMPVEFEIFDGYNWIKLSNFKCCASNHRTKIGFGSEMHFVQN
jgi:hypothetical protein